MDNYTLHTSETPIKKFHNTGSGGVPYFHEFENRILDLSKVTLFFIDCQGFLGRNLTHTPYALINDHQYALAPTTNNKEEAMTFLRDLTQKIAKQSFRTENQKKT